MNILDVLIFAVTYWILGKFAIRIFCRFNRTFIIRGERKIFNAALLFRMGMTWFYYFMVVKFGFAGDPLTYFNHAMHPEIHLAESFLDIGEPFVSNIARLFVPFTSLFQDPFLMLFVPFSLAAFVGSLFFIKILRQMNIRVGKTAYFFAFFMPNLVYWTSILGKDSLTYFAMLGFFSCLLATYEKFQPTHVFELLFYGVLLFFIRPHIMGCLLGSLALGAFLGRRKFSFINVLVMAGAIFALVLLSDTIFTHLGITVEGNSAEEIGEQGVEFVQQWQGYYEDGGSTIEREVKMSPLLAPFYAFWWLTVPYLWHVKKAIHLFGLLDGLIIQGVLAYILFNIGKLIKTKQLPFKHFMAIFILAIASVFGMALSNFGFIVRQRIAVLPFVFIFFLFLIQKKPRTPISNAAKAS